MTSVESLLTHDNKVKVTQMMQYIRSAMVNELQRGTGIHYAGLFIHVHISVTFGVCIYSLAGLLIVVLLWVLFTSVSYVVIATHAG